MEAWALSSRFDVGVAAGGAGVGVGVGACGWRVRIQRAKPSMLPFGWAAIYSSQLDNKGITEADAIDGTILR